MLELAAYKKAVLQLARSMEPLSAPRSGSDTDGASQSDSFSEARGGRLQHLSTPAKTIRAQGGADDASPPTVISDGGRSGRKRHASHNLAETIAAHARAGGAPTVRKQRNRSDDLKDHVRAPPRANAS